MEGTDRKEQIQAHKVAAGLLKGVMRQAVDFLFPPACPGCGRLLGHQSGLCPACWQEIRFIERPYCEVLGIPFSHDLGSGIVSAEAIASPPVFGRLRSVCYFEGSARNLVHALKYRDRTELAPMLALWMVRAGRELLDDCDVIVPVPLHTFRLVARRFNQAAELAGRVARLSGRPMLADAVRRVRHTQHQVGLGRTGRAANVKGAFRITERGRADVTGKRVLLIDDVYTTGATVEAVTRVLLRAGASSVNVLTFARAGIDTI